MDARNRQESTRPSVLGLGLLALDVLITSGSRSAASTRAGGTCGNVVAILATLGWRASIAASLDCSLAARRVLDDLEEAGVLTDLIDHEGSTPVVVEHLELDVHRPRHWFSFECPSCGAAFSRDVRSAALSSELIHTARRSDVVFVDRLSADIVGVLSTARCAGSTIVYEPSDARDTLWLDDALDHVDVLKYSADRRPFADELEGFGGLVVETLAADGLRWRWINRGVLSWEQLPAPRDPDPILDTCGAGDWLTAGMLVYAQHRGGLAELDAEHAQAMLRHAQRLAAWSCSFVGARGAQYEAPVDEALRILFSETGLEYGNSPALFEPDDPRPFCTVCSENATVASKRAFSAGR